MKHFLDAAKLRVIILPLVGAFGAIIALIWPVGHRAFCAGISGLVS